MILAIVQKSVCILIIVMSISRKFQDDAAGAPFNEIFSRFNEI